MGSIGKSLHEKTTQASVFPSSGVKITVFQEGDGKGCLSEPVTHVLGWKRLKRKSLTKGEVLAPVGLASLVLIVYLSLASSYVLSHPLPRHHPSSRLQ